MNNNELFFVLFYGAIAVSGLGVAIHYWYNELYKKRNDNCEHKG